MASYSRTIIRFDNGLSSSSKGLGANFNKNLDIYSDANSLTLNPALAKVSGITVTGLVKWIDSGTPYDTNKYFYDDAGNIYRETSGGTWSSLRSVGSAQNENATLTFTAAGQGLVKGNGYLYYTTDLTIGRYGPLGNNPIFLDDYPNHLLIDRTTTAGSGNNYTLPSAISETSANKLNFTPTSEPYTTVVFNQTAAGSGNWTLTIHDQDNNVIASKTNSGSGTGKFTFASPVRLSLGQQYHFHLTSSNGTGTVGVGTASDLSTAYSEQYFCLVSDSNYHPLFMHTNGTRPIVLIGNGNYIGVLTDIGGNSTYNPTQIVLEPGYSVRYFFKENEFAVAVCWKGTTIDGQEEGRLYYWDGIASYFNYSKPITSGLPNASVNFKNRVFSVLGSKGTLTIGTEPFLFIQNIPKLAKGKKIEVLPGAMDVWQNKAVIGMGANTDDSSGISQGVYEYGSASDKDGAEALNFGYTISTGTTQSTSMKIGAVKAFGKDLYVSWKDGATYGVDKASKTGTVATAGSWESGIQDERQPGKAAPQKQKRALRLVITFATLASGCTVTPKYRINRATSWTTSNAQGGTAGTTKAWVDIDTDYYEIEYGYDCTSSGSDITVTGIYYEWDPKEDERGDD